MKKLILSAIALAAGTMIGSVAGYAAPFTGYIFENQPGLATNATIAGAPPLNTADVTFTTDTINFASPPGSYTIGGFLDGAIITSGAGKSGDTLNNTYFLITGTATAPGGTASVRHDDGVQLSQDGNIVIDFPQATQVRTDTAAWAGAHSFQLSYGECCNGPAILQSNLIPAAVPEPASLALLGSALVGFGVMRRRRKTG